MSYLSEISRQIYENTLSREQQLSIVGRLRDAVAKVACAAEVLHQATADGIRILAMRMREVICSPRVGLARQLQVARLEEWPAIVGEALHQSPSKTGFFFAAKAS